MNRNTIISPRFEEGEYKGQDVVHYGIRIPLRGAPPAELLKKFSRRASRIIDSEIDDGTRYSTMIDDDLSTLRDMWFDPNDATFPALMGKHAGITAKNNKGEIIGGAIWAIAGANLFLHQLVSNEEGKQKQIPTRLIWVSVGMYFKTYHSLDIGVSYNPQRYEFFLNFAVEKYPIILKKPFYVPVIRLSPFRSIREKLPERSAGRAKRLDGDVTFFPRGSYALYAALKHAGVKSNDLVCVLKTFNNSFISGCVTNAIEKTGAQWRLHDVIRSGTTALVVVHEFGIPIYRDEDLHTIAIARAAGIQIIEDCAWRTRPVLENVWSVLSLQKMFDINYGGLLLGVKIPDDVLWSLGCLDVVKRERFLWEPKFEATGFIDARIKLWKQYDDLVLADGMEPDVRVDFRSMIDAGTWIPTIYMQKFGSGEEADAVVARLEEFGIQAGRYWGSSSIYLPIHQTMTSEEVEYMFAVVRGYFNLCRDYRQPFPQATMLSTESTGARGDLHI